MHRGKRLSRSKRCADRIDHGLGRVTEDCWTVTEYIVDIAVAIEVPQIATLATFDTQWCRLITKVAAHTARKIVTGIYVKGS